MLLFDAGFDAAEDFDDLSALFTFVAGAGMQDAMWHDYDVDADGAVRRETPAEATAFFAALDPEVYPSFERIMPVMALHDEEEQFLAGLDLVIAGIRAQLAGRRRRRKNSR